LKQLIFQKETVALQVCRATVFYANTPLNTVDSGLTPGKSVNNIIYFNLGCFSASLRVKQKHKGLSVEKTNPFV